MTATRETTKASPIQTGIGPGFLSKLFGGKSFKRCVVELLKNTRDWHAGKIFIRTDIRRNIFQIVDDGDGMNRANRDAFVSINMTTASGPRQSGIFCTGTKQMLFSHASGVEVRTAPKEEPELVYVFSFSTDKYESIVLSGGIIEPEVVAKDEKSWPHETEFGTVITYTLRNPGSRAVIRGKKLAEQLSALLPRKFSHIVFVDGVKLPPKEIVGDSFNIVEQHGQLGEIALELYRPKRKGLGASEDDLLLTGVEIGEVPMSNFFRVLADLRSLLPPVFLVPEVCGTISVPFIMDHINEDRSTLDGAISDDPRTGSFLKLLKKLAPEIQRRLEIKIDDGEPTTDDEEVDGVASLLNRVYNPKGTMPPASNVASLDDDLPSEPSGPSVPQEKDPVKLDCRGEYGIGETIEIIATIRSDLTKKHSVGDLKWYIDQSLASDMKKTKNGIKIRASEPGDGSVYVDLPGTALSAFVRYSVVPERRFRLSMTYTNVDLGNRVFILAVNKDKVTGDITWRLGKNSVGKIEPQGARVQYSATQVGQAVVTAYSGRKKLASCEINVVPVQANRVMCIRGYWFEYSVYAADAARGEARDTLISPINMLSGGAGSSTHRLIINRRGAGYQEALAKGILHPTLLMIISYEFARFFHLELERIDLDNIDSRDFSSLLEQIRVTSHEVMQELLSAKDE